MSALQRLASLGCIALCAAPAFALVDHDDQLVRVETSDGEVVTYGYAPNGTRLWREDEAGKTHYLNDLADVVGEFDAGGKLKTSFVHGPGDDDVLSARHGEASYYYHYDLVRSVTALTGSDGQVAARYAYDAFGGELSREGDASWNSYRYTSRTLDGATGLYHYRARTYDPTLGRFTSADPAGIRGGLNLYSYAHNDPTLFNDPFGFWPDWLDASLDYVGGAIDTGLTTVGGWVDDGVTGAGGWVADTLLPAAIKDEVAYFGRQSWAFTRGFGKGLYGATKGIVNLVRHPIDTFKGIANAIDFSELQHSWIPLSPEVKEAIGQAWDAYTDAAVNDPERFAEMTGVLMAEIVFAAVGTKGLDKLGKAGVLAKMGNGVRAVAGSSRVAAVTAPIVNATRTAGTAIATRFPRTAALVSNAGSNIARRANVLNRARRLELARRAAATGPWWRVAPRRVANFGRDLGGMGRMAFTRPGALILLSGTRLSATAGALVASTGRGIWVASKYAGIPLLIAFEDNITDAIGRSKTRKEAMREVTEAGERLLADAARLSPEELAVRIREVGDAYVNFRNRLLKPIHEEDLRLDRLMGALNDKVEAGEIPPETIDARLDAMLKAYGSRRHNLMVELYDRNRDEDHDMLHPSMNRTISFQDEIDLIEAVGKKVTDPLAKTLIEARVADLQALMEYEYNLFRAGDHDDLIAGIAGVPREVGAEETDLGPGGLGWTGGFNAGAADDTVVEVFEGR